MITWFIFLQSVLLLFMAFHDWIDFSPFTDIHALRKHHSFKDRLITSFVNTTMVAIPLVLTLYARGTFTFFSLLIIFIFYLVLTIGTICAWWIPYIFGSTLAHKQGFAEYKNTHTFLPARGDNVVPNTLHIVLHLLVWSCLFIAAYYLYNF